TARYGTLAGVGTPNVAGNGSPCATCPSKKAIIAWLPRAGQPRARDRRMKRSLDPAGAFKATYAELYDRYLVPMLFMPYARIMARRASELAPRSILETAAGTGALTQELAQAFPGVPITATDLNQPMIDQARTKSGMGK